MINLTKVVRGIIWAVVLILLITIAGVSLFGAWRIVEATKWENNMSILTTIGSLFVCIVLTFLVGGFTLWIIREHILPTMPQQPRDKDSNNA